MSDSTDFPAALLDGKVHNKDRFGQAVIKRRPGYSVVCCDPDTEVVSDVDVFGIFGIYGYGICGKVGKAGANVFPG